MLSPLLLNGHCTGKNIYPTSRAAPVGPFACCHVMTWPPRAPAVAEGLDISTSFVDTIPKSSQLDLISTRSCHPNRSIAQERRRNHRIDRVVPCISGTPRVRTCRNGLLVRFRTPPHPTTPTTTTCWTSTSTHAPTPPSVPHVMSSQPSQAILNDLAQGIATDKPQDLVQYCADWFQRLLREEVSGERGTG